MNKIQTPFGFSTIVVGNLRVNTCKVAIKNPSKSVLDNIDVLQQKYRFIKLDESIDSQKFTISFESTDYSKSKEAQLAIGLLLKKHQQDKLDKKYSWVNSIEADFAFCTESPRDVRLFA